MIKRIFCLISVFIIILSCSCITVNAETIEEEVYIVDMTDEEINDLLGVQLYGTTSSTVNIARWNKCIDNTQAEDYGYSVQYYCPNYNNVLYNQYIISYGQTGSAVGTRAYRLLYFNNNITWNAKYNNFKNGTIIMIASGNLEEIKNYLFSETYDRTAINATVMTSTDDSSWNWTNSYSQTYQFNNTNHSDAFYIYYKGTHETEPPHLQEDGTCYTHNYENGICLVCGAEEPKENDGILAKVKEWFQNLINTITGTFNDLITFLGEKFSNISTSLETIANMMGPPDVGFLAEIDNIVMNNMEDNGFFVSVCKIQRELSSLFSEDYTDPNGFYEINPLKFTMRRTPYITEDGRSYYYGRIDWGIENTSLLNLDWFFGTHPDTGNGKFVNIDGTPAVKAYSDKLISAFLWLAFGYMLWSQFPQLLSGEIGTATRTAGDILEHEALEERKLEDMYAEKEYFTTTETKKHDGKTYTYTKKRRVK